MTSQVLVVDDQQDIRWLLTEILKDAGYGVSVAIDGKQALEMVGNHPPDLVLLDVRMPGLDGFAVLRNMKQIHPGLPVIMLTAYGEVADAVEAMRKGAADYLLKPFLNSAVILSIRRALDQVALVQEVHGLRTQIQSMAGLADVMGSGQAIQKVFLLVRRVAGTMFTVILQGETGTGKELVARAIHIQSDRRERPFLAVDCGAIPETLIESQLFGHERGAFTGAAAAKQGDFELASGGTLFLDEVNNLPLGMQASLLRVLQERQIRRVGGQRFIDVDIRLLVASNADLQAEVRRGTFREDLFHRLSEFVITIPPLRRRGEDIVFLSRLFLDGARRELKKHIDGISEEAVKCLIKYPWPGNVRELKNIIRRAALLCDGLIKPEDLLPLDSVAPVLGFAPPRDVSLKPGLTLKKITQQATAAVERQVIQQALRLSQGNRRQAARLLAIDEKTLRTKSRDLGIQGRVLLPDSGG
jgi:DNA-binding NtrC family response regulator